MENTRLLIVDDEPEFRSSTSRVLARRGFTVRSAGSGEEALARLAEELPDLVLLDLKMDGLGGIETLRRIREDHPELPVIILTGHADASSALAGIRLDIVDFLQKPVDIEGLTRRIRVALARERHTPLREKTVAELMVSTSSYRSVTPDASVRDAFRELRAACEAKVVGRIAEVGHRSILVRDRDGRLHGILRMIDVLEMVEPPFLRDSPWSTGFTGMFLAQCKVLGQLPISDYLDPDDLLSIQEDTPLMEALALMTKHRLINLPVMRDGQLTGVLRDRDLFLEILGHVAGD